MATTTRNEQPWRDQGLTKPEWVAREVAKAVNAGKAWKLETVDFSDPNRPLTCLEVDFPMVPINELSKVEASSGAAKKPIYLSSKWWARRQPSVFRAMLLAAAVKAPDEPAEAAKHVWDIYYGNHQKNGAFKGLNVADIFMGGGTTLVEGSRLGMRMFGNDLNPVAWFVVKNELSQVDKAEVEALLADIEAEVRPQIMPFYACDCPRGHKGKWTQISTGRVMDQGFDPLTLSPEERKGYRYEGPEIIYTFWAKHGPCQVTGCGHRTPIMSSPVIATKSISVKSWRRKCKHCNGHYDLEEQDVRIAPGEQLVVSGSEQPYAAARMDKWGRVESATCPLCRNEDAIGIPPQSLSDSRNKTVDLSLLIHPAWLRGEPSTDGDGQPYGGSADDAVDATIRWNRARSATCALIEVRGALPAEIVLADGTTMKTGSDGGTAPKNATFTCQAATCGMSQLTLKSLQLYGNNAPVAMYAIHGFCPHCRSAGNAYGGRFFSAATESSRNDAALREWYVRRRDDLSNYWPRQEIPFGDRTHVKDPLPKHGITHWWEMFNALQLLTHSQVLKALHQSVRQQSATDAVLSIIPQVLRANCMFSFWNVGQDCLEPFLGSPNYNPKNTVVGNCVFQSNIGRGTFSSYAQTLLESIDYADRPWDLLSTTRLPATLDGHLSGKTWKLQMDDRVAPSRCKIDCGSSSELVAVADRSVDLVITDPPFGGIMQYAELSDFFYVWLRLVLKDRYPKYFAAEHTPKAMEAVANSARHEDPDVFYQRMLTECWREAARILKPGGLLAFTFHHNEDQAWVSVLESLFNAGFSLNATYPIRSDESKGDKAQFGSQMIEYDIIHVCRQRHEEPKPISWAKLRRQVLQDVREIQELLEHHQEDGLPEADLQVIRRGKALEYFSRHYGKVYKDQDTPISVLEALLGINQLLDEEAGGIDEPPPHNAEPFTRMLLRLFDGKAELPRDQIQKFLKGTGSSPSNFEDRGWIVEKRRVFHLVAPLDLARQWVGRLRKGMTSDYDQAMYLIGACFENSGINASETLNNPNFRPHPALGAILSWFKTHGADSPTRNAATIASQLYKGWEAKNQPKAKELTLFDDLGEEV